jgi:Fe-Mn family superoxide dismutase
MAKLFTVPPLPYDYGALEPYIDALTMEIHHNKHHQAYVDNLNKALENYPDLQNKTIEEIMRNLNAIPEAIRTAVRNNGGGHINHSMFWLLMKKNGGGEPKGKIAQAINQKFGSFASFQNEFNTAAKSRFGSGWAWLVVNKTGDLTVESSANQDTPFSDGKLPIFGIDVWEHAYYLKYQNRRPDYITAWWNVVNWETVYENYERIGG